MKKPSKKKERRKPRVVRDEHLYAADPNCKHDIISGHNGSGIRCSKCPGWFCY